MVRKKQKTSGFTLIELVIVLTIMGVFGGLLFKGYGLVQNHITRQQKIMNAWRFQRAFLRYYDHYGRHPGCRFKPNRWFLLSDANVFVLFKEFMSDQAREGINDDKVIFFQPTVAEQQKAPEEPLWFYLIEANGDGSMPNPLAELNEELETEIPFSQVFGWGTEVLFYVPPTSSGDADVG